LGSQPEIGYYLWRTLEHKIDISIIIAMYNSESSIETAIQSVLQQESHGLQLEIIVVDDGSTDRSSELVSQIKSDNIRLVELSKNQGQAHARNVGLSQARGEWIQFLDSDDRVSNDLYSKFERTLQPGINCYLFSFMRELPDYTLRQTIKAVNDKRAFGHFGGTTCNKFIKKEICLEFKPFLYSDICFCVDMMNERELHIGLVKEAYYWYNKKREESITSNFNKTEFDRMVSYLYAQIDKSDRWTKMFILEIGLAFLSDRNVPISVSIPVAMKMLFKLFRYLPATLFNQNRKYVENVKI
jgi:glycosyltransferase involved in cell wall biosynthesis